MVMRTFALTVVWVVGVAPSLPLVSQSARQADRQRPPWVLEGRNVVAINLPAAIRAAASADALQHAMLSNEFKGVTADLNGDADDDYLLQGDRESCGTGGCPYVIVDGASAAPVGLLFGDPIVVRAESTRAFHDIDVYSRGSSTSGSFTSYVYDGSAYVRRSIRALTGSDVSILFAELDRLPRWRSTK